MTTKLDPDQAVLHLRALRAVLDAARENLDLCTGGYSLDGRGGCGKPAIYTYGSPNVRLCKLHGRPHEGRHDLWPHAQQGLVAAIAAYDGLEGALPDLPDEALPDEESD